MPARTWKVAGASVRGFGHEADGTPCQDNHAVLATPDGWLFAVACDGAGTAKYSDSGSRLAADGLVALLEETSRTLDHLEERERLRTRHPKPWITEVVAAVRGTLVDEAELRLASIFDFHATVVGCIVDASGEGLFFQIGDGAGVALNPEDPEDFVISEPENGPYAETTFFITEEDWRQHLRFTPFSARHSTVILLSDGVTGMALEAGPKPFRAFLDPVIKFLEGKGRLVGEKGLAATLASDQVRSITHDDKTLVWAARAAPRG